MPYYLCNYLCIIVIFAWDTSQSNLGRALWTVSLTPDSDPWLALTGNCRKNYFIVSIVFWFRQSHHHRLPWVVERSLHQGHLHPILVIIVLIFSDSVIKKLRVKMNMRRWVMTDDDQQLLTGSWKLAKFISDNKNSQWEVSRNWGELRSIYRIISPRHPWSCDQV